MSFENILSDSVGLPPEEKEKADFEKDLENTFCTKIRADEEFCTQIWSALANVIWRHIDGTEYSCSFRYAGGLIAKMRNEKGHMDYMNWYCSGPDGVVSKEIAGKMKELGWTHHQYKDE